MTAAPTYYGPVSLPSVSVVARPCIDGGVESGFRRPVRGPRLPARRMHELICASPGVNVRAQGKRRHRGRSPPVVTSWSHERSDLLIRGRWCWRDRQVPGKSVNRGCSRWQEPHQVTFMFGGRGLIFKMRKDRNRERGKRGRQGGGSFSLWAAPWLQVVALDLLGQRTLQTESSVGP